ncbi:MAG TPA: hypothetical protein VEK07_00225 [Polyangiaceae bacterium]|nr:hypothetical protein [Polyangiaceae bacterium]
MSITGDSWYVKLSDGDVHRVTLDQLDEAFQAGHIDGNTMVLASGATQWTKLGALAGIDDDEAEVQVDAPSPVASRDPAAIALATPAPAGTLTHGYPAQPAPVPSRSTALPTPSIAAPARSTAPTSVRASGPGPLAHPAGVIPSPYRTPYPQIRPIEFGAQAASPVLGAHPGISVVPGSPLPNSLRPISMDFEDLGDDPLKLRRGSAKRWVAALLALSVLGTAGVVSVRRPSWARPLLSRIGLHTAFDSTPATSPPTLPVAQPALPTPPPALPTAEPVPPAAAPAATAAGDSPLSPHFTDRSSDDSKVRSADTDKPKAKGHKARAAAPAGASSRHAPAKTKSTGFTTGGSKYDPLNSSI